jgi:hypothetical protein
MSIPEISFFFFSSVPCDQSSGYRNTYGNMPIWETALELRRALHRRVIGQVSKFRFLDSHADVKDDDLSSQYINRLRTSQATSRKISDGD